MQAGDTVNKSVATHGFHISHSVDEFINRSVSRISGDLCVPRSDSFPMNTEKRHLFLIFTMFPSKIFSKILREKL